MTFEFFIGFLVSFAIFLVLTFYFIKYHYNKDTTPRAIPLFFIGIIHLILAVFSFLWFFSFLSYSKSDFLIIYSLLLLIQGFLLFRVTYKVSNKNKNLFYLLFFFFLIFFLILFLHILFLEIFIMVYFLFVLLLSLNFLFRDDSYRNLGLFGIFYSGGSLLLHIFVLFGIGRLYFFSIFYSILLFVFLIFFFRYLKANPVIIPEGDNKKKNYFFVFLRDFIFTLAFINLVFIGVIVIHEFSHLGVSYLYNCVSRQIVYSGGFLNTQILCSDISSNFYVALGGPVFPILIGIILFFIGGKFLKEIGLLMIGFNLLVSSKDFSDLGISNNLAVLFIIFGIFLVVGGIILLAKSKTEESIYSSGKL